MWVWLLAVVILAVTWLGGFIAGIFEFPVPLSLQLGITLLVVLCVGLWLLYRRFRAGNAAKELRRELLKESSNANVLPAQRAGLDGLRRQFEQATESLKARGNGSGSGAQALYTLPWYVIIGPPGAGKTTALRHSGLDFPAMGGGLRGAGGTRNCDWWFSSEAILLDTAGRWAVQGADHEEWLAFLRLILRFRSRKPLNGLIVAVAVDQLLQSSEEQIEDLAKKLRSRVDEVITELRMVLPVYLMLTKTDLLGGFVEFFSEMRLSERQQVLGASLALSKDGSPGQTLAGEFDLLMRSIERRMVQRIGVERHGVARQRIYEFPLELAQLRDPLAQLVDVLFQKNPFQESPTFRGFYFTSGTQEGRSLDRVISGMAQAFGLVSKIAPGPPPEPKSYFVSDMFRRVMFPDRNMASRTVSELRRQRWLRIGVALASVVVAALILFPGALSFAANLKWVRAVTHDVERAQELKWRDGEPLNSKFVKLDPVKADLKQVRAWRASGYPAHMGWGMYTGDKLEPALVHNYEASMNAGFREPAQAHLEQRLSGLIGSGNVELSHYSEAYDLLKLYLMASMPDRLDLEWASPRLQKEWEQAYAERAGGSIELMSDHLALYLALVKEGRIRPWEADQDLVARARQVLSTVPVLDRIFELVIKPANEQYTALVHTDIFYGAVAPFVKSQHGVKVPGAFSRRGWASVQAQLQELEKTLAAESWVLGTAMHKREEVEARIEALRAKYFANYLVVWRAFLTDLQVVKPGTARQALRETKALSEPRYPYERLLASVKERGFLDELKAETSNPAADKLGQAASKKVTGKKALLLAAAGDAVDRLKDTEPKELTELRAFFVPLMTFLGQEEVGDRAASSGLERYQAILRRLSASLDDPDLGKSAAAAKEIVIELGQARREAATLVDALDAPTQQLLRPLLMNPLDYSGVDPETTEPEPQSQPPLFARHDGGGGGEGPSMRPPQGVLAASLFALAGLCFLLLGRARPTRVGPVPEFSPGSI